MRPKPYVRRRNMKREDRIKMFIEVGREIAAAESIHAVNYKAIAERCPVPTSEHLVRFYFRNLENLHAAIECDTE